ncbi:Pam17p [Coccidioides immitis RMSCC 3703]|uniref:Presequence translocated-associated motor subunit PAM17 n=1 Tax=Coccidioides immitis RMSCC 3703 TaxID=454286 RepID=A0A0J8R3I9_COCIT|nr:Pam17p [Coccidioides immitis RMSCC 3703]
MHLAAMTCPARTAVLGGRASSSTWISLAVVSSPIAHAANRCRNYRYTSNGYSQQRRAASSSSSSSSSARVPSGGSSLASHYLLRRLSQLRQAPSLPGPLPYAMLLLHHPPRPPPRLHTSLLPPPPLQPKLLFSWTGIPSSPSVIASQNFEALGAQIMGFDPFIVMGLTTVACGAVGWLAGPVLGNAVWGMVYRKYKGAAAVKEKEFYDRIKRFRVDPSANSFANPVPDYYGEKIGSVQGYRQWLKDQRAYNRKKRNFV